MKFTSHNYYNNLKYIKTNNNSHYSVTRIAKPTPSKPKPSKPKPSKPKPSKPKPSKPTSSKPTPSKPTPSKPTPSKPTPSKPIPSNPTPSKPIPSNPTPSKLTPSKPTPSKPTPSNPTPSKPIVNNSLINSKELFNAINVETSNINNNKIPKYVFQTWKHKLLSKDMKDTLIQLRNEHKDYKFFLYDDVMCREFIAKHFDANVLSAFDSLIPGAYKADLWRYCVLYIYGGVYMDIKLQFVDGFNLNTLIDKEYFPKDIGKGIWQGFLICKPKNEILKHCIDTICINVKNRFYGNSTLHPTGPGLMYNIITHHFDKNIYINSKVNLVRKDRLYLIYNNKPIIQFYDNYGNDKKILGTMYGTLWLNKKIYN